ncbi:hypothetical protein CTA1_8162 [Colletotrichum tanaceti]|uniref:Uncharacterized protein n=1 Tax=Colletotrichum tanaceti TaxID=1306861 RepID=A0A4U6XFA5_9PEZI|nr:hypothetical protein CTA1_8162 [Colletotrichum tanaceti]
MVEVSDLAPDNLIIGWSRLENDVFIQRKPSPLGWRPVRIQPSSRPVPPLDGASATEPAPMPLPPTRLCLVLLIRIQEPLVNVYKTATRGLVISKTTLGIPLSKPPPHRRGNERMATRRWYLETSPDGRYQFVSLKRSRSHHYDRRHHHHHHDPQPPSPPPPPPHRCCRDDCAHITREEWNDLVERERKLREVNDCLARENYSLKCNLQASNNEGQRLSGLVTALQAENQLLREEIASLRCSIDSSGDNAAKYLRENERLKSKLSKVEKERDGLLARVRELSRHAQHGLLERIEELKRLVLTWERKFDAVDDHNKRLRRDLEAQRCFIADQEVKIRLYERVLRRHGFIRCD